jgi:hypothetical protein
MSLIKIDKEKNEVTFAPFEEKDIEASPRRRGARELNRKGVENDKLRSGTLVGSGGIDDSDMFASGVVNQAAIGADAVGQSELKYEQVAVTVSAGQSTGTATVTSGAVVFGAPRPTGNQDQFIDNCSVSGTTLTITLAANATADNTFEVTLLKS